ncbi:ATP-dependent helicase [Gulosibacter sp. ACHW.36C]|uniref:ATP-dependent helicase n=1 Tax=Gulosibacter sediminis TaxID=1729695 RepID=A0ABY4MVD4_9MICO|nr:ATP-dependent helicase [Gulosibacter sediminis]UQN14385.1 ATP-dependent helicase [Gulosibacter sediminis]
MSSSDALAGFSESTTTWFRGAFDAPTRAQREAWAAIRHGHHTLVVAPTGSGKTLAAFLWAIDQLIQERANEAGRGTRILYISPLKALGVDVERNLAAPLVGIRQTAVRLGHEVPEITVGVRSGDTTPSERRAQVSKPPDILITTPESLYLMLTSSARKALRGVRTVIIDEVHAVAASKRGSHLALSLERLDALLESPAQRVGLSATVRPLETVARFLGGQAPVEIVAPASEKAFDLRVVVPVADLNDIPVAEPKDDLVFGDATQGIRDPDPRRTGTIWPHIESAIVDRVLGHRSTIVFVNSRGLAERLTARLNEEYERRLAADAPASTDEPAPRTLGAQLMGGSGAFDGASADLARAHHGSVSKEQRAQVEDALKSGTLRCVVATSSLELGIDMGDVDLVIQVESPPSVASGLQRVGRAGHQVGEVSRARLYPKHRADVLHTAVATSRMLDGNIERMTTIEQPLDVLAQHTVSAAALDRWQVQEWLALVRRSAPFAQLSSALLESVLDLLAGKYPSDEFATLRPRLVWDRDADWFEGRPGAQRLAVVSGGTIPDRGMFGVFMIDGTDGGGKRVGELDEEMVYESRVGDVIALGATSWRIREIGPDRVLVVPAFGEPGRLPFWKGDGIGRPAELGAAIGATVREIAGNDARLPDSLARVCDDFAQANISAYVREQLEVTGHVPTDRQLLIERVRDELGDWRIILHSPYGRPVHAPWALMVTARVRERFGMEASAMALDDGIIVRIPDVDDEPPGADLFAFERDEVESTITREVGTSALFAARFRENAARALLLPRLHPGKRAPLWQQRLRAAQLLEVARKYPEFPMILETVREVLHDVYDLDSLTELFAKLATREVRLAEVTTESPSPFAQSLLFGYVGEFMYEGDQPLAERRAAALQLDTNLLADLLGASSLRELLDLDAIHDVEAQLQWLEPSRRARDAEGLADLLRVVGPLSLDELRRRVRHPDADPHDEAAELPDAPAEFVASLADTLITAKRALWLRVQGTERLTGVEDAARLRDALGVPLPIGVPTAMLEPVADPLGDLVRRYARTHAPFRAAQLTDEFGLGQAVVADVLRRLEITGTVQRGEFTPGVDGVEWVDAGVLRRIRSRTLAKLRSEIEPVTQQSLGAFLPEWQHVGDELHGIDGVVTVIDQLQGVPIPASAWESLVLPARVRDYSPAMLDELLGGGEVLWLGHGAIGSADGWVSLHLRDTAAFTLPEAPADREAPSPLAARCAEVLEQGGAMFVTELIRRLEQLEPDAAPPRIDAVIDALWELTWLGIAANDALTPLRALLSGNAGSKSTSAHRTAARPARGRLWRGHAAATAGPSTPPQGTGRWSIAPTSDEGATTRAQALGDLLLDRYGVVTRGSVEASGVVGGFALVYRVLARFEESGHARRGYFVEHLGASQFAAAGAIDRLRAVQQRLETDREARLLTLAATDPANAYGAAVAWPEHASTHRPGRKAGGLVTLADGALVLYVERGGKTMLTFTDDDTLLRQAAYSLSDTVRRARIPGLVIERANGASVFEHGISTWLQEAGFVTTPRGLRLKPESGYAGRR